MQMTITYWLADGFVRSSRDFFKWSTATDRSSNAEAPTADLAALCASAIFSVEGRLNLLNTTLVISRSFHLPVHGKEKWEITSVLIFSFMVVYYSNIDNLIYKNSERRQIAKSIMSITMFLKVQLFVNLWGWEEYCRRSDHYMYDQFLQLNYKNDPTNNPLHSLFSQKNRKHFSGVKTIKNNLLKHQRLNITYDDNRIEFTWN